MIPHLNRKLVGKSTRKKGFTMFELAKRKQDECISQGAVYYGLLLYRAWIIFIIGIQCALIPGSVVFTIIDTFATTLGGGFVSVFPMIFFVASVLVCSIPFVLGLDYIYRLWFKKKYLAGTASDATVTPQMQSGSVKQPDPTPARKPEPKPVKQPESEPVYDAEYYKRQLEREKTLKWGIACLLLLLAIIVGAITYCLGRMT